MSAGGRREPRPRTELRMSGGDLAADGAAHGRRGARRGRHGTAGRRGNGEGHMGTAPGVGAVATTDARPAGWRHRQQSSRCTREIATDPGAAATRSAHEDAISDGRIGRDRQRTRAAPSAAGAYRAIDDGRMWRVPGRTRNARPGTQRHPSSRGRRLRLTPQPFRSPRRTGECPVDWGASGLDVVSSTPPRSAWEGRRERTPSGARSMRPARLRPDDHGSSGRRTRCGWS